MVRRISSVLIALLAWMAGAVAQQAPAFRVVNNTTLVVNEVYASPTSSDGWGHDRLGAEVIGPGARQVVRLPAGECRYDIRIVFQGGTAEERRDIDTCRATDLVLGGGTPAQAGNPSFNLVNRTGQMIEQLYASPSSTQNWGADRLGDKIVRPGQRLAVRLPQGECQYDIRVVLQGGTAREQRRVDACALTDYVVQ